MHFQRHADRVSVVFEQKYDRQSQVTRGVERLPKLAFAGRAIAERNVNDLIVAKIPDDLLELLDELNAITGFGAPDCLQKLSAGR